MALTKVQIDGVEFSDSTDLNVDNGTLVVDSTNNRVGVGTTSPADILHLESNTPRLIIDDTNGTGNNARPGIIMRDSGNTNLFTIGNFTTADSDLNIRNLNSSGDLVVWTGNNETFRIDSSGRVGIGTSSPSTAYGRLLHIHNPDGQGASLHLTDNTSGSTNNDGFDIVSHNSTAYLVQRENADMVFMTNGTNTRMVIKNDGKVGIGTTSPGHSLAVRSGTANSDIANFTGATVGRGLVIGTSNDGGAGDDTVIYNATQSTGGHVFEVNASEKVRIDSSGRLLVGTSSGTESVHVNGAIASVGTSSSFSGGAKRAFFDYNGGVNRARIGVTSGANNAAQAISFHTSPSGSAPGSVERFRFGPNGEFGIGGDTYGSSGQVLTSQGSGSAPQWATAAGGKVLQVVGTLKTNGFTNTGSGYVDITDLSQSITVSASSRVMVTGHVSATANAWNEGGVLIRILRGTTEVGTSTITPTNGAAGHTGGWDWSQSEAYTLRSVYNMPINFVDTALSAGTYTYKVQIRNKGSNNRIQVNSGYYGDTTPEICMTSALYLMEIGA